MSDLFHNDVPDEFIERVFDTMRRAHWHTFQVLTKRAERMGKFLSVRNVPENVWVGVSVENQQAADERIPHLMRANPPIAFLSMEPLLGPVNIRPVLGLNAVDTPIANPSVQWVIVGGESGPSARPMKPEWVRDIRNQCQNAGIP